jgi:Zn-dependent peptidase ImmA (M78 family)/transcriptional regulator with XRE-family HTH domain
MSKPTPVPITPSVLTWAMRESGYTPESLAKDLKVSTETIAAWLGGSKQPNLTEFWKLVSLLKRPPATFLLPTSPISTPLPIQFRRPSGASRSDLTTRERHAIRGARRLQETVSWILRELEEQPAHLPQFGIVQHVEQIAPQVRQLLTASLNGSFGTDWQDSSDAWEDWRKAVEGAGILVFQFSMGKEAVGGFSLWDDVAPVIAINTAWNSAARIFSLFHELGHLVTRTSSACLEARGNKLSTHADETERWCERFAAAVLIPRESLAGFLEDHLKWHPGQQIVRLDSAKRIANNFRVSLRSSVLRLIELGWASWSLYQEIPPYSDDKPKGGGGTGRVRGEIREDQYGERTVNLFVRALQHDILGRSEVLDYLDMPDSYLDGIQERQTTG